MSVSILKKRKNHRGLHFVTFGSQTYENTKFRLADQAKNTDWFKTINCHSDKDIFLRRYNKSMSGKLAGFAWWKPAIVLELFKNIPKDDIVFYLDAGSNIIKEREKKVIKYLEYVIEHSVLAFSSQNKEDNAEKMYTKRDLMIHLNCDNENYYHSQFSSGHFFVVNNEFGISFMRTYLEIFDNIDLANDTKSLHKEHPEFIAHRHDQSILSLLYKKTGLKGLLDESYSWGLENGPWGPFSSDRISDIVLEYLQWPKEAYTLDELRKLVYRSDAHFKRGLYHGVSDSGLRSL